MPKHKDPIIGRRVRCKVDDGKRQFDAFGTVEQWVAKQKEYLILLDDGTELSSPILGSWDVQIVNDTDAAINEGAQNSAEGAGNDEVEEEEDNDDRVELGLAALKSSNFEKAVEHFSLALEEAVQEHGDLDPACAELYYHYASALRSQVEAQLLQGDEKPASSQAEGGEEDEDLLELAWESAEAARQIWQNQSEEAEGEARKQAAVRLSDALLCLGDIQILNGKYDEGLADLERSLSMRERICDKDDRRLAEIWHRLGLFHASHPLRPDKDKAAAAINHAISVLHLRKTAAAHKVEAEGDEMTKSGAEAANISDIEGIIKELTDFLSTLEALPGAAGCGLPAVSVREEGAKEGAKEGTKRQAKEGAASGEGSWEDEPRKRRRSAEAISED